MDTETAGTPSQESIFALIHRVRYETTRAIDTVMTYEHLCQTPADYAVVKPLTTLFAKCRHPGLPYALLLCRSAYLESAEDDLAFQGVNNTRAALCEVLATKLLSLYDTHSLDLATVLTNNWNPFSGATRQAFENDTRPTQAELDSLIEDGQDMGSSAIEIALETRALRFIRSPPVQQFVNDLHNGHLLYRPSSHRSLISDNYKAGAVEPYNMAQRGIFDHYVLRVPRIRRLVDTGTVLILVILFAMVQHVRNVGRFGKMEGLFIVFSAGFALEEAATIKERGLKLYFQQIWNVLDLAFLASFTAYFVTRVIGLRKHDPAISTLAFDILSLSAIALAPRLCGTFLRDSLLLLGLRAMLLDFLAFMVLACICSFGFVLSLTILADGSMSMRELSWLCVKIALGSAYLGFEAAPSINPTLAPGIMLVFAIFSQILLLTVLVSILTNTFSLIQFNVVDEALYQRAVSTLDMVKGDALMEFLVPFNLVALPLLVPASFLLDERRFHQFNVFLIRVTNLPLLLIIWLYYEIKSTLLGSAVRLTNGQGSGVWDTLPNTFRRSATEKLFERRVNKEGRRVRGLDEPPKSADSQPLTIRGSGGAKALGVDQGHSPSSNAGSIQPANFLAQLFVPKDNGRSGSPNRAAESDKIQKQLDRMEEMLSELLTGGMKLDNDDR